MTTTLQANRSSRKLTAERIKAFTALGRRIDTQEGEAIKARGRAIFKRYMVTRAIVGKLRARRIKLGLSLSELSTRTGIAKSNLSRLENNERVSPTLETLHRYARALGMTVRVELN